MGQKAHAGRPEPCAAHLLPSLGSSAPPGQCPTGKRSPRRHTEGQNGPGTPAQAPMATAPRAPLAPSPRRSRAERDPPGLGAHGA